MSIPERIEISFSKRKLQKRVILSIVGVLISIIYLIYLRREFGYQDFIKNKNIAIYLVVLNLIGLCVNVKNFKQNRYLIIIDNNGITDCKRYNRFIPWSDVSSISKDRLLFLHYLEIKIKNTAELINKEENKKIRKLYERTFKNEKSSLYLYPFDSELSLKEIKEILCEKLIAYNSNQL